MSTEYYTGPGGVFYDPRNNQICLLTKTDEGVLTEDYKIKAALYNFERKGLKAKRVLIEGTLSWIKIGNF